MRHSGEEQFGVIFIHLVLLGALVGATSTCQAAPFYAVTAIPTPVDTVSHGNAVNNVGQVVGSYRGGGSLVSNGFIFSNGQVTDLPTPPEYMSALVSSVIATSINDAGSVTGYVTSFSQAQAFSYANGRYTLLGTLPGAASDSSYGSSINGAGQVVGTSLGFRGVTGSAFLYSNGEMMGLMLGRQSAGNGINNAGQVTGTFVPPGSLSFDAYIYNNGKVTDLGTPPGFASASGIAINDGGQVLVSGSNFGPSGPGGLFLYTNGQMTDLGTLAVCGKSNGASYELNVVGV